MNYYSDTWLRSGNHGHIFYDKVDHSADAYQYQERIFRQYINSWLANEDTVCKNVLELGAGFGRITKIMIEELKADDNYNIMNYINSRIGLIKYDCVDLNSGVHMCKAFKHMGVSKVALCSWLSLDITSKEFGLWAAGKWGEYDLILASEVFMHILPSDIDTLIGKLTKLLSDKGSIINIDWFESIRSFDSEWCFMHNYEEIYLNHGLTFRYAHNMSYIKQALFHYGRK